jgi:hypothetical protein
MSTRALARALNDLGIRSAHGKAWHASAAGRLLVRLGIAQEPGESKTALGSAEGDRSGHANYGRRWRSPMRLESPILCCITAALRR